MPVAPLRSTALLAAMIPVVVVNLVLLGVVERQQHAQGHEALLSATERSKAAVERLAVDQVARLQSLSSSKYLEVGDLRAFREEAQRLHVLHPEWLSITLTYGSRKLMDLRASEGGALEPVRYAVSRRHKLKSDAPMAGDVLGHGPTIRVPVDGPDGSEGTLVAALNPAVLSRSLAAAALPPGWAGFVVDGGGIVLADTLDVPDSLGKPVSNQLRWTGRRAGKLDGLNPYGQRIVGLTMPVMSTPWQVGVWAPYDLVEHPYRVVFWVLAGVVAVSSGVAAAALLGCARRWLGTVHAETRRLEDEASRERAENHAKSAFLATVSHELRTPLHGILGYSDLLEDGLDDRRRRYVSIQRRAAQSLLALVNDILDFSRIQEGRLELERVPFDLLALVGEAMALVRPMAMEKSLATHVWVDSAVPRWVLGDPTRVRQVLLNLLGNAVKFTQAGQVSVDVTVVAKGIRIEVTDTGVGIPADKLGAIFDRFTQADEAVTRRFGGTGLGLAIVRSLARLMGGDVDVRSEIGVGSTFGVTLPLEAEHPQREEPTRPSEGHAPTPGPERLKVLLAEDLGINRMLVREVLERAGHLVVEAADGAGALSAWAEGGADLILMDYRMPVMSGAEAAEQIRRNGGAGSSVPIIGLTADRDGLSDCVAAGMDDCLFKPASASDILAMVERHRPARRTSHPPAGPGTNLAELRSALGGANLRLLLETFAEQAEVLTHEFAAAGDDMGQLRGLATALKGSAGMLGFAALAAACGSLLVACRADHPYAAGLAAEHVVQELKAARTIAMAFVHAELAMAS